MSGTKHGWESEEQEKAQGSNAKRPAKACTWRLQHYKGTEAAARAHDDNGGDASETQHRSSGIKRENSCANERAQGFPCTLSGTPPAAFAIRKTRDLRHDYDKGFPAREEKETRGAYGGERRTEAHAEETGARRRAQGAQAHPPEPGQITLRPQSVTGGGLCPVECVAGT